MSENKNGAVEANGQSEIGKKANTLVDAIFDVGTAWAEYGLGYGRFALEHGAKALTRTAAALETLQAKLKKEEKAA